MYPLKLSTAVIVPFFAHDVSGDAVTGLVDAGFTKRISKNGGTFSAMTVTITELENGWYSLPLSAAHSDTTRVLSITLTHASIKQVNLQFRVHARVPDDLAFPTVGGRSLDITLGGAVGIDWGNIENPSATVDLAATDISLVDTATALTNPVVVAAGGIAAGVITAAELINIADTLLDRRLDLGADSGGDTTTSRTVRQALRTARNRVAISAGTMTVYEEDDVTADFTALVTRTAGDPIVELNPA